MTRFDFYRSSEVVHRESIAFAFFSLSGLPSPRVFFHPPEEEIQLCNSSRKRNPYWYSGGGPYPHGTSHCCEYVPNPYCDLVAYEHVHVHVHVAHAHAHADKKNKLAKISHSQKERMHMHMHMHMCMCMCACCCAGACCACLYPQRRRSQK